MAKNRSRSTGMQASSRSGMSGNRRGGGRQKMGAGTGSSERGAGMSNERGMGTEGARGRGGRKGVMAGARAIAENVGETTMRTARDVASGARGAASSVARTTQGAADQVVGYVREHPWPSLLIGAGATWLAIDAAIGRGGEQPRSSAREGGSQGRESSEPGRMSRTWNSVSEAGRGAGEQVQHFVRENPMIAGAAALGVGVAVGMALPGTMQENRMLGNARDSVVRRAKTVAEGTMRSVRGITDSIIPE